jgi:hypothetical protein
VLHILWVKGKSVGGQNPEKLKQLYFPQNCYNQLVGVLLLYLNRTCG